MKSRKNNQLKKLLNIINKSESITIRNAIRYDIDSVYDNLFRLIISKQKEPLNKDEALFKISGFDIWGSNRESTEDEYQIKIVEKELGEEYGLSLDMIHEGRVFLSIDKEIVEITKLVHEHSKQLYESLIKTKNKNNLGERFE